jgi:hypothetical protein
MEPLLEVYRPGVRRFDLDRHPLGPECLCGPIHAQSMLVAGVRGLSMRKLASGLRALRAADEPDDSQDNHRGGEDPERNPAPLRLGILLR